MGAAGDIARAGFYQTNQTVIHFKGGAPSVAAMLRCRITVENFG